jgi:hypothetical protein
MRRVLRLHQLYMFCLQRHSIHCTPSTKARSRCIVPLRSIHLYLIIPVLHIHLRNYLFRTRYLQRLNLHLPTLQQRTKVYFLGGISLESKNSSKSNDNNYDRRSGATIPDSTRPNRTHPHPVFALSHRLLAYASPPLASSSSPSLLGVGASANASSKVNKRLSSFLWWIYRLCYLLHPRV